ncbi:twitching motility protein PilT [Campylobacterota bacterium]|nr:twitching motility protein PilT [Campylobacterota bacterium]
MIVLDTSVWIEYLRSNESYFARVSKLLEMGEVLAIDCVFGELLQGAKSKREQTIIKSYYAYLPKSDRCDFVEAGLYANENRLIDKGVGLIDTAILLTAIKHNAQLWTLDKKLLSVLPPENCYQP